MKKKTINAIITKKVNAWLDSIEDKELVLKIKNDIVVTGGCITSMLLNEDVNDFDIYLKTKQSLKAVCQYYCNRFNENNQGKGNKVGHALHAWVLDGQDVEDWKNGNKKLNDFAFDYPNIPYTSVKGWAYNKDDEHVTAYMNVSGMLLNTPPDRIKVMINSDGVAEDSDFKADKVEYDIPNYLDALSDGDQIPGQALEEKPKYKPVFLSSNAITLSDKIQVVVRFYGEPDKIHENYDFVHCTNYWTFQEGVVLKQPALEAIMNKELVYVGSKYPICSLVRTRKFIKRGWQINAGQYVKMSFQISKLDLTNIFVLEDQLVGVDSIYFLNFIKALKEKQMKDSNFVLNQQYLSTVIDKIFG
jgi:hypothetical protein